MFFLNFFANLKLTISLGKLCGGFALLTHRALSFSVVKGLFLHLLCVLHSVCKF